MANSGFDGVAEDAGVTKEGEDVGCRASREVVVTVSNHLKSFAFPEEGRSKRWRE